MSPPCRKPRAFWSVSSKPCVSSTQELSITRNSLKNSPLSRKTQKFQQYYNGGGNNGNGGGNGGGGGAVDPDPNDGGPDEINSNHYRPTQVCSNGYTTIASFTTNPDNPEWDLSDYKRAGKGYSKWSIRETSHGLEYASGSISSSGLLQGLPKKFNSTYNYDGYMELAVC